MTGLPAASPVGTATRREPGHVVMPAQPLSQELVICPTAQVKNALLDIGGYFVSAQVDLFYGSIFMVFSSL